MPHQQSEGPWPTIAIIIIIIVLALGGLYYLSEEVTRLRAENTARY